MATVRNLKIKTSTCKRIVKELHSYEKEVEREAAKTADMKANAADPHDIKQQTRNVKVHWCLGFWRLNKKENVLAESRMMLPDCHKRLEAALTDLKGFLVELEESDLKETPEIQDAQTIITEIEHRFQIPEA